MSRRRHERVAGASATRREVDRADREWFHFLGLVTTSLAASLAIVLFATLGLTLAGDLISPVFVERRGAILAGGIALVWVPVAFVAMRRRLAAGVARGELPATFDPTRGSAALCVCALLSAAVVLLQIVLTRLFSAMLGHHMAFLAAGGTTAQMRAGMASSAEGQGLITAIWKQKLEDYEQPALDDAVRQELEEYVVRRRAELGD